MRQNIPSMLRITFKSQSPFIRSVYLFHEVHENTRITFSHIPLTSR